MGLLVLAENESKNPTISRFAPIVAGLLSFAITFKHTLELNNSIGFLVIES